MEATTIFFNLAERPQLHQRFPNLLKVSIEFAISCPRCRNRADKIITTDKNIVLGELFSYPRHLKEFFKTPLVPLNTPR